MTLSKKLCLAALFIGLFSFYCISQTTYMYSQSDVNAFDNSTTTLNGNLIIITNSSSDPITNLSALLNLTTISGFLEIRENNSLLNINGLVNLTSIGDYLHLFQNEILSNVDGFSSLTSIGGNLQIPFNNSLTNLDGLRNLTSIGGQVQIVENTSLTNCCAIQILLTTPNAIGGTIFIFNNPSECSSAEEIIGQVCENISIFTNRPCIDADNGSIQVQASNTLTPLAYNWEQIEDNLSGNGTSNEHGFIIENLSAGTYFLTITDVVGTEFTEGPIGMVAIPGSIFEIIEATTTNSSNGTSNGAIDLVVSGGTPPYNLSWSGPSSGTQMGVTDPIFTISALSQGEYDIIVSDNNGNQQTVSIYLLDEIVPVFPCTQPLDIVILNDVSGSVDAVEYNESKQFFVDFLNEANIGMGQDDSRAAIIEWSGVSEQNIQIPITGSLSELQNYINSDRVFNGLTSPHDALTFGENYLASVARPNAERVLILSTDGSGGQVSPSLASLADEYKAAGYHIITIAFDNAFENNYTRNILRQVASIDLLAPGAPAYSQLDQNLANNIVNLYLCPIDPGSSATVYFNRDGAIDIIEVEANEGCPNPESIDITFTIEALRELSIPPGTPVTFYYNDPALFGATQILTWIVPCAIPAGTTETFAVTLPVTGAANIFAILNDDGEQSPPIDFPITDIDELAYSNNISDTTVCVDPLPTLQAFKYTTTPMPICNNIVIYTVDVCNISDLDASGVVITDDAPNDFILLNTVVNNNGCSLDNNGSYDIPGGCCVSITFTYDASNAANSNYNDQDVLLSGEINQVYLDFDGATTAQEDVLVNGTVDCPSTVINFTKEVNVTDICEDAFLVYTFTIDNQLNVPLQGLLLTDVLPEPVSWVFQPYNLNGLSISNSTFVDGNATFIIDEVEANITASFSIDAYLGNWTADGVLNNTAELANVPNLENGGIQILSSNSVTTNVKAIPEIEVNQIFNCTDNSITLTAEVSDQSNATWSWVTTGDGSFSETSTAATIYTMGSLDLDNEETILSVSAIVECGEINQSVEVVLERPEPILLDIEICEGSTIMYEGTALSAGDSQDFTLEASNGCDSIVSVTVVGVSVLTEDLTLSTCEGETVDYNDVTLSIGDSQDFVFQAHGGCDSIVSVTVLALPISEESITLTVCDQETIDYNGMPLPAGTIQAFTFENNSGCDSIVTVTVVGLPSINEAVTLQACEGEMIDYHGTPLYPGDTQAFTLENSHGCDSIVTVTVIGVTTVSSDLTLETCEGETIDYNGTSLSAGDTQSFTFQNMDGCDSIISVTVIAIPSSKEKLTLETCAGEPISYEGNNLFIGDERTISLKNRYGCDSIITVNVIGKGFAGKKSVPNIFSPNGDNINDCFHPYFANNLVFQNYKMNIFDRWGGQVFSTSDPYDCWDGRIRGSLAENGVYVWLIEIETEECELSVFSGDVVLIR